MKDHLDKTTHLFRQPHGQLQWCFKVQQCAEKATEATLDVTQRWSMIWDGRPFGDVWIEVIKLVSGKTKKKEDSGLWNVMVNRSEE